MQNIHRYWFVISALGAPFLGLMPMAAAIGQSLEGERLSWPTQFVAPDLSDRNRPDGRSRGGASRAGGCELADGQSPLTALVPSILIQEPMPTHSPAANSAEVEGDINAVPTEIVLSLTTQTHPSFWFYIPYELDGSMALEFVLQDTEGTTLYRTQLAPNAADAGILSVSLPEASYGLATETPYRWFLVAYCDPTSPVFVEGWMERVELTTAALEQLEQATPRQQATIYAEHGVWQDALITIGNLYRDAPESGAIAADWLALLKSAGLENLIGESFLPIFYIENTNSFSF